MPARGPQDFSEGNLIFSILLPIIGIVVAVIIGKIIQSMRGGPRK